MLHVAFAKLARGGAQQCSRTRSRFGMHQRHHVLQLIAEPERAARLIERRCAPTAGRREPGTPASHWPAQSRAGRAFRLAPRPACDSNNCHTPSSASYATAGPRRKRWTSCRACSTLSPAPRRKTISRSCPADNSNGTWIAAHGSSAAPTLPESRIAHRGGTRAACRCGRGTRCDRRVSVAAATSSTSKNAIRPANSVLYGIAREQRTAIRVHLGDHVHAAILAGFVAQHPFPVAGDG